jgi:hypothetical protein
MMKLATLLDTCGRSNESLDNDFIESWHDQIDVQDSGSVHVKHAHTKGVWHR